MKNFLRLLCLSAALASSIWSCDSPSDIDTPRDKVFDNLDQGEFIYTIGSASMTVNAEIDGTAIQFSNDIAAKLMVKSVEGKFFLTNDEAFVGEIRFADESRSPLRQMRLRLQDMPADQGNTTITGDISMGPGAIIMIDYGGGVESYVPDDDKHFLSINFMHDQAAQQIEVNFEIIITLRGTFQPGIKGSIIIQYEQV